MIESIIDKDKELLIFLNNLGSEFWDPLWLTITNQLYWSPLFIFIFYLIIKFYGWKNGLFIIFSMILLVAFSDQFTNFIKHSFQRLRPCNTDGVFEQLRSFTYRPGGYSFYSGHASLSMTFTVFIILLLKNDKT